jgi:hypothetical protein
LAINAGDLQPGTTEYTIYHALPASLRDAYLHTIPKPPKVKNTHRIKRLEQQAQLVTEVLTALEAYKRELFRQIQAVKDRPLSGLWCSLKSKGLPRLDRSDPVPLVVTPMVVTPTPCITLTEPSGTLPPLTLIPTPLKRRGDAVGQRSPKTLSPQTLQSAAEADRQSRSQNWTL